jgi:predicted small lipoprotein YifL
MNHVLPTLILLALAVALTACGRDEPPPAQAPATEAAAAALQSLRKPAPPDAAVYFISPANGDRVTSPVTVIFGLKGMGVAPAGIDKPDTGHHHLLVDTQLSNPNIPLPKDDQHLHFGDGQTQVKLELAPGSHQLQLVLGDHLHIPHEPPVLSEAITIEVVAGE